MRTINTPSIIIFLFALLASHSIALSQVTESSSDTFSDAVEYNDFVVNQQNQIGEKILVLVASFQDPNTTKDAALEKLKAVTGASTLAISKVEEAKPFPSGEAFQKAAINLFTFYNHTFRTIYPEVIDILFKESPTVEDESKLGELFQKIQAQETEADKIYTEAQAKFAEKNEFQLKDNEFQEQFKEK